MPRTIKWLIVVVLVFGIVAPFAGAWMLTTMMLLPPWYEYRTPEQGFSPRSTITDPERSHGLAFEPVEFAAVDGSILRGWFVPGDPEATAGIVAVHGGGADRRHFLFALPMLHAAGYPVLLFDCREHGISDGSGGGLSFGIREQADTRVAVAWMKKQHAFERIAVVGSSQGAASAIIAAALDPAIDVVVAENSYTDLFEMLRDTRSEAGTVPAWLAALMAQMARSRLQAGDLPPPIDAIGRLAPRPILLMHGTLDNVIPATHSAALFAAAGDGKEIWILEDGHHSALFRADPEGWEAKLMGFLERTLGPAR